MNDHKKDCHSKNMISDQEVYIKTCPICNSIYTSKEPYTEHRIRCILSNFSKVTMSSSACNKLWNDDTAHNNCVDNLANASNKIHLSKEQHYMNESEHYKLESHMLHNTGDKNFTSILSPLSSAKVSVYPRTCMKCSRIYKSKNSFSKHNRTCNGISRVPDKVVYPRTCSKCFITYGSQTSFFKHKKKCNASNILHATSIEQTKYPKEKSTNSLLDHEVKCNPSIMPSAPLIKTMRVFFKNPSMYKSKISLLT